MVVFAKSTKINFRVMNKHCNVKSKIIVHFFYIGTSRSLSSLQFETVVLLMVRRGMMVKHAKSISSTLFDSANFLPGLISYIK